MIPFLTIFALLTSLHAQTWSRLYDIPCYGTKNMLQTSEGNFVLYTGAGNTSQFPLLKFDQLGGFMSIEDETIGEYQNANWKLYPLPNDEVRLLGTWAGDKMFEVNISDDLEFSWQGLHKTPFKDFVQLPDGDIISSSIGGPFTIVRTNANWDTLWKKDYQVVYAGAYNYSSVIVTKLHNGNLLLYGTVISTVGQYDLATRVKKLIEITPTGTLIRNLDLSNYTTLTGNRILKIPNGYIFLNGSDFTKISNSGAILGSGNINDITVGLPANFILTNIIEISDENYVVSGYTQLQSTLTYYVCKVNSSFESLWTPILGSKPMNAIECKDKGFLIASSINTKLKLTKTDSLGNVPDNYYIKGQSYFDKNQNCLFDSTESPVSNRIITLNTSPKFFSNTDSNGFFKMEYISGNHSLKVETSPYETTCPNSFLLSGVNYLQDTLLFGIQNIVECPLLRVSIGNPAMRPCFEGTYHISCCNEGNLVAENAAVKLNLNPDLTLISTVPSNYTLNGNDITFPIGNLEPGACVQLQVRFKVKCDAVLGETICSTVSATPDTLCLPLDSLNFGSDIPAQERICRTVTGSFDPNDKQVFPEGTGVEHLANRDTTLQFMVRFQNTGTDTAFTVVIKDVLSNKLDPATFKAGVSSHPYTWGLSGRGELIFRFDQILLPDSFINEQASHGFVQFSIKFKNGVKAGDKMENRADIYFDFNAPVLTNTAFLTVDRRYVYGNRDTTFCENIKFNNQLFTNDTSLIISETYTDNYLIVNYLLHPKPEYLHTIDTTLFIGDSILSFVVTDAFGIFQENATTTFGCDSITKYRVNGLTVGTKNLIHLDELQFMPNPFEKEIMLVSNVPNAEYWVEIYDLIGVLKWSSWATSGKTIDLENLPIGSYFAKIKAKNGLNGFVKILKK
jgi:uncharacterized repeat protein (TIGR01451 family)